MKKLKLKFDPNQEHQLKAVQSAVGLFEGLPFYDVQFQMAGDDTVSNLPPSSNFEDNWLAANLRFVQEQNEIQPAMDVEYDEGSLTEGLSIDTWRYPKFTIEMETGTGKTYAYFRTIHELRKRYGFRKFIIIVPSIAIYEGTIKTFDSTKEHFRSLYENEVVHKIEYEGRNIGQLKNFASSTFTEIMIMTLDSFNKSSNVIYRQNDLKFQGERMPYHYIQETRPILILDESQNYLSEKAKSALRTLKPLFALCYSATPKEKQNLVYRLGPVEAFKKNLVKKIEVLGVTEEFNLNNSQLQLVLEELGKGYLPTAKVVALVNYKGKLEKKTIELKDGDNLYEKTKNEDYKGYVVREVNRGNKQIIFENGEALAFNESKTVTKRDIFKTQIEETIKYHFRKQDELRKKGIKVLSLFFIDRVANYKDEAGIIRKLFEEAFENLKGSSAYYKKMKANDVHRGYFAQKQGKKGEAEFFDTHVEDEDKTKADKDLEKAAYELIMKEKEKLLMFEENVSFIFAHSALKEGWDNPNVFQICTLNDTKSEMKKRQEIGRGLRISVNQDGDRVMEEEVNVLTVIANQSYQDYVGNLQKEYAEAGDVEMPKPSQAKSFHAKRNNVIYKSNDFKEFWKKLCVRTNYTININSEKIIEAATHKLNSIQYPEPQLSITKGKFIITEFKIELIEVKAGLAKIKISISDTDGRAKIDEGYFNKNDDLSKKAKDDRLKGLKIVDIIKSENGDEVQFGDKRVLTKDYPILFHSERGQATDPRSVISTQTTYPVFNLIERTAKETTLTKPTVLKIFKNIDEDKRKNIFKNPEGFAEIFIREAKNLIANHIAEEIEYNLQQANEEYEMEDIFPEFKKYVQKELISGSENSLYDEIQIDSEIERRFVQNQVQEDGKTGKIICYFKFPNSFKINFPKIIGNYIPDWGIIRVSDDGSTRIQLVRETKGSMDKNLLQFPSEIRKINCAEKHFKAIGINYRHIDGKVSRWWV